MSKKHYVKIAEIIAQEMAQRKDFLSAMQDKRVEDMLWRIAATVGTALKKDNAAFDMSKFMTACGFPTEDVK